MSSRARSFVIALIVTVPLLQCAAKKTNFTTLQPDGRYRIGCEGRLSDCLERTDKLCKSQSFSVDSAFEERSQYGHENGESYVERWRSEAVVRCGKAELDTDPLPPPPPPSASSTATGEVPGGAAPTSTPPVGKLCTPGTTQTCVGAAACAGGQACLPDGSGYGPCDCGPNPPPTLPVPSAAP